MLQIDLLWTHSDPKVQEPQGRSFDAFFRDGGAWRQGTYELPDAVINTARAQYCGPDRDGYGVAVRVWDGTRYTSMELDAGRSVLAPQGKGAGHSP